MCGSGYPGKREREEPAALTGLRSRARGEPEPVRSNRFAPHPPWRHEKEQKGFGTQKNPFCASELRLPYACPIYLVPYLTTQPRPTPEFRCAIVQVPTESHSQLTGACRASSAGSPSRRRAPSPSPCPLPTGKGEVLRGSARQPNPQPLPGTGRGAERRGDFGMRIEDCGLNGARRRPLVGHQWHTEGTDCRASWCRAVLPSARHGRAAGRGKMDPVLGLGFRKNPALQVHPCEKRAVLVARRKTMPYKAKTTEFR